MGSWLVGVDVGGTFTDLLSVDPASGRFELAKVPTTLPDQAVGFRAGLTELGAAPAEIATIVHGTTAGTNAVLERKGAVCGLVTTRGFRDVLELGRRTRPFAYGMIGSFEALIPRELRLEVAERVDAEGNVVEPLDEAGLRAAVRELRDRGVEALVIHFLHAYANPEHERRAVEIARELWPNDYITAGSAILPEFREYERGTTAALNAFIQPTIARYIGELNAGLQAEGLADDLLVMQGNGGMMAAPVAGRFAVHTVMSGPAAGALAAARIAGAAGYPNAIGCDMGGTSFDVALIRDGAPAISSEREISYGVPVRVPMIDIHTIGSGGGSLARVDRAGLLRVGPASAGSTPGPIAFGRGGTRPTVTDANLLLGRLNPAALTGSAGPADLGAIQRAMAELGAAMGLAGAAETVAERAAQAVLTVANHQMAGAMHLVSVGRGYDPRDFVLFAFGGAGPLHAAALARELGVPRVLVPRYPGITSALGCVLADVRHDFVRTLNRPVREVTAAEVGAVLSEQSRAGHELIRHEGVRVERVDTVHEADLLYRGQTHVLRVPLPPGEFDAEALLAAFAAAYRARFDIELAEMRAVLVNLRTTVVGRRPALDLGLFAPPGVVTAVAPARRPVCFDGAWLDTPIYRRETLPAGFEFAGPAIVEQLDATTVVPPGDRATVDALGNLVVALGEPGARPVTGGG